MNAAASTPPNPPVEPVRINPTWHAHVIERLHCPHPACQSNKDRGLFGSEMRVCFTLGSVGWYHCDCCGREYQLRIVELKERNK